MNFADTEQADRLRDLTYIKILLERIARETRLQSKNVGTINPLGMSQLLLQGGVFHTIDIRRELREQSRSIDKRSAAALCRRRNEVPVRENGGGNIQIDQGNAFGSWSFRRPHRPCGGRLRLPLGRSGMPSAIMGVLANLQRPPPLPARRPVCAIPAEGAARADLAWRSAGFPERGMGRSHPRFSKAILAGLRDLPLESLELGQLTTRIEGPCPNTVYCCGGSPCGDQPK